MTKKILSSITNDDIKDITGISQLRGMLDNMPNGVQVLRAIRNKLNEIIDFTYVLVNKIAEPHAGKNIIGKKMLKNFPGEKKGSFFKKLVTVVNTGVSEDFIHHYKHEGLNHWFNNTFIKFGDGVLVTHEDVTSLKAAEELLKDRETFINLITSSAPDLIYIIDVETRALTYVDAKVENIFGSAPAHLYEQGHNIFVDAMHPDDYVNRTLQLNKLENVANDVVLEVEARVKIKEGTYRWFRMREKILERQGNGKASKIIGVATDIQELKQNLDQLKRQEGSWLALIEAIPDVVNRWNKDLKLIYANAAFEKRMGFANAQAWYGKDNKEMGFADDIALPWMQKLREVFETGMPANYYSALVSPDGTTDFYARLVPEFNQEGNVETVLSVARDSSEIKEIKKELKGSKDLIKAAVDSSQNLIQSLHALRNRMGEIVDFRWFMLNDLSLNVFGNLVGQKLLVVSPDSRTNGLFEKYVHVTETGQPMRFEMEYNYKKQTLGWYDFSIVKVDDGVVVTAIDITELKRVDREIHGLNKELTIKNRQLTSLTSELNTFNTIAANDYETTLRHLYTSLEFIIRKDARNVSDAGKAHIRRAQTAIQKLKLLTGDIVAFSKIEALNGMVTVNLNVILHTVCSDLDEKVVESGAIIEITECPTIQGYPHLLSLLFNSLLDNAIKFRKKNALPNIQVKYAKMNGVKGTKNALSGYHKISIVDDGIGIEQTEAENIFSMFYRLHGKKEYKGSGIGLAICKKIMDLHGGFITAEVNPGNGSTFHCFFLGDNQ